MYVYHVHILSYNIKSIDFVLNIIKIKIKIEFCAELLV
jgi:hypothetical protein